MSLIDCGCGPGTITIELAGFITPGHVVGIDFEENQKNIAQLPIDLADPIIYHKPHGENRG